MAPIGSAAKVLSIHARRASRPRPDWPAAWPAPTNIAQNVANADLVLVKPVNWVNPQASVYSQLGSVSITLNGGSLLDGEGRYPHRDREGLSHGHGRILADLNAQIARYEAIGRACGHCRWPASRWAAPGPS